MPAAALYARFSTDMQSPDGIRAQLAACRKLALQLGAEVTGEFEDAAISGQAMANRPGLQDLLALARTGTIDLVIAEHTDRLSRDGGHTWEIYRDLRALGVRIWTVNQGEIGTMHVGLSGTMSELLIEEIGRKTRRGLSGVVRSGRSAAPVSFGYEAVFSYDAKGERIRGLRQVRESEAAVVRRIFTDYAAGVSPIALATRLNKEAVPGPRGHQWNAATIHGSAKRGVGLLRNELYRGVMVWGRHGSAKDRATGRRRELVHRPSGEVHRVDVPDLRIVDEDLWERVQLRLAEMRSGPINPARRRPSTLLGGLIRCGLCGGGMTLTGGSGQNRLRCARHTARGAAGCTNTRTAAYSALEARVLASIQANLLHPDVVEAFVAEYQATLAAERRAAMQNMTAARTELAEVKRRAARLIHQVEEGMPWTAVAERHQQLAARQAALEGQLAAAMGGAQVIELHPAAAGLYRRLVEDLLATLAEPEAGVPRPAEARDHIRRLVTEVLFIPGEARGQWDLEFTAQLAPVLGIEAVGPVRLTA